MGEERNLRRGFTLIEMSIVLVIIGLVVGGILTGRELIYRSEVSQAVSDLQKIRSSVGVFREKYGCLPGDCRNASTWFSQCSPDQGGTRNFCNGDGNGTYDNGSTAASVTEGTIRFWEHLQLAGLSPFSLSAPGVYNARADFRVGENMPTTPWLDNHHKNPISCCNNGPWNRMIYAASAYSGSICPVFAGTNGCETYQSNQIFNLSLVNGNVIVLTQLSNVSGTVSVVPTSGIDGDFAESIDGKIDDRLPLTGSMRGWHTGSSSAACTSGQTWPPSMTQSYRRNGNCTLLMDLGY